MATSIDGKSSFHPSAHQSRSNGPVSPTTDPSIRVTPAFSDLLRERLQRVGCELGVAVPDEPEIPVDHAVDGRGRSHRARGDHPVGTDRLQQRHREQQLLVRRGGRVTQPRCPYHCEPSSPIVTDIRRSPISASIRSLPPGVGRLARSGIVPGMEAAAERPSTPRR